MQLNLGFIGRYLKEEGRIDTSLAVSSFVYDYLSLMPSCCRDLLEEDVDAKNLDKEIKELSK